MMQVSDKKSEMIRDL